MLAERVSLTPPPGRRRFNLPEREVIINSCVARLDAVSIGQSILAFAHVSLEYHHATTNAGCTAVIEQAADILECHMTSGGHDYMLRTVATDMKACQAFITARSLLRPDIHTINTGFSPGFAKYTTVLLLQPLQVNVQI